MLHDTTNRIVVAEFLYDITSPRVIENFESLKILGEIIKYMLTAFVHDKDHDYKIIYAILLSSQFLYSLKNKRKIFLTTLLNDHGIWQDTQKWKSWIQRILNKKF